MVHTEAPATSVSGFEFSQVSHGRTWEAGGAVGGTPALERNYTDAPGTSWPGRRSQCCFPCVCTWPRLNLTLSPRLPCCTELSQKHLVGFPRAVVPVPLCQGVLRGKAIVLLKPLLFPGECRPADSTCLVPRLSVCRAVCAVGPTVGKDVSGYWTHARPLKCILNLDRSQKSGHRE